MYERINPVLNGTTYQTGDVYVNPGVPVHVVQGTAGVFQDWNFVHPQPEWSAFRVGKVRMEFFIIRACPIVYVAWLRAPACVQQHAHFLRVPCTRV